MDSLSSQQRGTPTMEGILRLKGRPEIDENDEVIHAKDVPVKVKKPFVNQKRPQLKLPEMSKLEILWLNLQFYLMMASISGLIIMGYFPDELVRMVLNITVFGLLVSSFIIMIS